MATLEDNYFIITLNVYPLDRACLPSCFSKCVCRRALRPSRAAHTRGNVESTGRSVPNTSGKKKRKLQDSPVFCRCTAARFLIVHGGAGTLGVAHHLRSNQEVEALRYGLSLGLKAGCDRCCLQTQNSTDVSFPHAETRHLNLSTKTRRAFVGFVPNIPSVLIVSV